MKRAKFDIGTVIHHKRFGYYGVIIDVDPLFLPSGRYNPQALKWEFTTKSPWYRVLIDDTSHVSYVEEHELQKDEQTKKINHPHVDQYLIRKRRNYVSSRVRH